MKDGAPVLYPNDAVAKAVSAYAEAHSLRLPPHVLAYHAHVQETMASANYMISTSQSQSLVFLARLIDAKRVLEIGVYVGYSALVWSHAVGPAGTVTGLEFNPDYAEQARAAFAANDIHNVEVLVGDALETLPSLGKKDSSLPYDVIFIDAQKAGYPAYLATILARSPAGAAPGDRLLRRGGLVVADNVLRRGLVADDDPATNPHAEAARERAARAEYARDDDVARMREFNDMVGAEPRLENFLLPLWDGANLMRLVD